MNLRLSTDVGISSTNASSILGDQKFKIRHATRGSAVRVVSEDSPVRAIFRNYLAFHKKNRHDDMMT